MKLTYRPEIDGLRAIAVLAVIFFHAGIGYFNGGYVGVDVFFVISGYLITSIIRRELRDGTFTLLGFYERRVRRIIPALLLVTTACLPFGWLWLNPDRLDYLADSIAAVIAFASNFFFWQDWSYFSEASTVNPMLHTWSLAIEEQFYIVFPLTMIFLWRRPSAIVLPILLGATVMSFGLGVWLTETAPSAAFYLTPSRAWELLIGVLMALALERRKETPNPGVGAVASLTGLALILLPITWYDERTSFPGLAALAPTVGTALLIGFADASNIVGRVLSARPVVGVGLISYSAYLWHQPIFAFARIRGFDLSSGFAQATTIALVLLLATLSWRFVERPFRDRSRTSARQVKILFGATLSLSISVGAVGVFGDGFRGRYIGEVLEVADRTDYSPLRAACHTGYDGSPEPKYACIYFGHDLRWAVLGDSHAVEIAYALAKVLRGRDEGLLHLSHSDCPPAYTFETKRGCSAWTRAAVERLVATPEVENVLIVYRHTGYLFGDLTDTYPEIPDRLNFGIDGRDVKKARERYWASFLEMVERLHSAGKKLFIVYPIPELGKNIASDIFPRSILAQRSVRDVPGMSDDEYDRRNAFVLGRLAEVDWAEKVIAVRPKNALCGQMGCPAIREGVPYYFDAHHLTLNAARLVVDELRKNAPGLFGDD